VLGLRQEVESILGKRWDGIPVRRRPPYASEQRFRILRIKHVLGLSCAETGERFRIAGSSDPTLQELCERRPRGGHDHGPDALRRRRTHRADPRSGRLEAVRDHGCSLSQASNAKVARSTKRRAQRGRPYPNHVWMCDLTQLKGLFGLTRFRIGTIFDVHSRMPLLTRTFDTEPTGDEIAALFRKSARLRGKPRHFISNQGRQFTSEVFGATLDRLSVRHRFGALGRRGSIAIIERFWLKLKVALSRLDCRCENADRVPPTGTVLAAFVQNDSL
jgi:hypothetical protein